MKRWEVWLAWLITVGLIYSIFKAYVEAHTVPCSRKQELSLSDVEAWKAKSEELKTSLDACVKSSEEKK